MNSAVENSAMTCTKVGGNLDWRGAKIPIKLYSSKAWRPVSLAPSAAAGRCHASKTPCL
jgi:hypothetical protein